MELKIYTRTGAIRHTTDTTRKESTRVQQLMNDNYVQIVFDHTEDLHFRAGDNITYKGDKFTLIQDYKTEVKNEYEYHYELKFEGSEGYFKTLPFFHYITNGDLTEKEPEVSYTATLSMAAEMAIISLRNISGDNAWKVGALAGNEESKYLNFASDSVFDAFGKIADEFSAEWWIDGKTINFARCECGDLQTLSAKAGGGLSSVEIAANNEIVPNRIYAYGNTRNITKKYTSQGLAYNTRLRLPAGVEYVEVTGGAENVISKKVFFDNDNVGDIYPRRVGIITKVDLGGTAEAPVYYFYDKDIDFDPAKQLIEGTTMMVHFESGALQGRDFELGYSDKLKRFEIINTQEGDIQVPFGSIIPKVGDKYVLWNIEMPQSYITNAEKELQTVAQEYVDNLNKKTPEITCKSFEPYFDEYGNVVTIGSRIKIEDDRLKGGYIESRVTKYSYPLFCESQVEFTLSENVASGRLTQIENKIEDVTADNAQNVQYTRAVSRRGWRDAQELTTALEALQAELLLVGNPESQFSCSCVFKSNKNNDPNLLAISAGELQHVVYKGQAGDKWIIEGAEFALSEDTLYYIYLKCSKSTNKGNPIISHTRLGIESQEGYYLFLGGVVSSIFENARIVNIVSGFTQIAGGNITTERIQDPTGKLIIDLTSVPPRIIARNGAKFIGSFSFESADGLDNIEGVGDMKTGISTAQGLATDAKEAAIDAQNTATEAKTSATTANEKLSDWASDSYISPMEKTALKQQQYDIQSEYAEVIANAGKYAIATQSYTNAYTAAISAFSKYTDRSPEIIPIEDDYANISAYYPARQVILDQISDASKAYSEKLVDDVQVGGVNLARATKGVCQFSATESYFVKYFDITVQPKIGEEYTLSWDDLVIPNDDDNYGVNVYMWSPRTSWEGVLGFANNFRGGAGSFTITIPSHVTASDYCIAIYRSRVGGGMVTNLRLVRGNKPMMSWSPAPEDVTEEINAVKSIADAANASIAAMNDDGIMDISEKQSIRNQWENISGIATTDPEAASPSPQTGGSHIRIKNTAVVLSINVDALVATYDALRNYLHSQELYSAVNTPGFNRSEMASQFTAYFDAEIATTTLISQRQAMSQGNIDKDALAKGLGYKDYADMTSGKALFDGGYISADVLKADRIMANSLRTSLSGKRVEIIGDEQEVSIYDGSDIKRIYMSGDSASDFIPPATNTYNYTSPAIEARRKDSGVYSTDILPPAGYYDIVDGAITKQIVSFVKFRGGNVNIPSFTCSVSHYVRQEQLGGNIVPVFSIDVDFRVKALLYYLLADGSKTIHTELANEQIPVLVGLKGEDTFTTNAISTLIGDDGNYVIELEVYHKIRLRKNTEGFSPVFWDMNCSVPSRTITSTQVKEQSTSLFANGLLSWWGVSRHFGALNIPGGDFMRAIDGNCGFKLNSGGLQLMANGAYNNISNGYIRSTDGLMIQWGIIPTGANYTVYFPTSFYVNPFSIVVSPIMYPGDQILYSAGVMTYTASKFTVWRGVTDGASVVGYTGALSYIAIGRWRL